MIFNKQIKKKNKVSPASSLGCCNESPPLQKSRLMRRRSWDSESHSSTSSSNVSNINSLVDTWTEKKKCRISLIGTMFVLFFISTFLLLILFTISSLVALFQSSQKDKEFAQHNFELLVNNISHTTSNVVMSLSGLEIYRRTYLECLLDLEERKDKLVWMFLSHMDTILDMFGRTTVEVDIFAFENTTEGPVVTGCIRYEFGNLVLCDVPDQPTTSTFNYTIYNVVTRSSSEDSVEYFPVKSIPYPKQMLEIVTARYSGANEGGTWEMVPRSLFGQFDDFFQTLWKSIPVEHEGRSFNIVYMLGRPAVEGDERFEALTPEGSVTWGLELNSGVVVMHSLLADEKKLFYPVDKHPNSLVREWSNFVMQDEWISQGDWALGVYSSDDDENGKYQWASPFEYVISTPFQEVRVYTGLMQNTSSSAFSSGMRLMVLSARKKFSRLLPEVHVNIFVFASIPCVIVLFTFAWGLSVALFKMQSNRIEKEMKKLLKMNLSDVNLGFFFFSEFVFFRDSLAVLLRRLIRFRSFIPTSVLPDSDTSRTSSESGDRSSISSGEKLMDEFGELMGDDGDGEREVEEEDPLEKFELGDIVPVETIVVRIRFKLRRSCTVAMREVFYNMFFGFISTFPGAMQYDFGFKSIDVLFRDTPVHSRQTFKFARGCLMMNVSEYCGNNFGLMIAKGLCYQGSIGSETSKKFNIEGKPFDDLYHMAEECKKHSFCEEEEGFGFFINDIYYQESDIRNYFETRWVVADFLQVGKYFEDIDNTNENSANSLVKVENASGRWILYNDAYETYFGGSHVNAMKSLGEYISLNPHDRIANWKMEQWRKKIRRNKAFSCARRRRKSTSTIMMNF